jgi:hypothetical protein
LNKFGFLLILESNKFCRKFSNLLVGFFGSLSLVGELLLELSF